MLFIASASPALIMFLQPAMADQETHTSRAEQRMAAVAKLKRAASLPRMKDGRRPPMHVEAVSEGEKAPSEEEKQENLICVGVVSYEPKQKKVL